MQQTKRHHFVPKAYLKAFCDPEGRLLVYRKDGPREPLRQVPDATQFRGYYYSQPTPEGSQDNNTLEAFFSTIEQDWPETVAKLHKREDVNDRLQNIFEFMSLQRARVPAARDAVEATLAQTVKDTMQVMLANGKLPAPPQGLEDLPNQVRVSIDPHMSIHAMVAILQGMGKLYSMLGFAAVHNTTARPFLTSDNPVLWFDPSVPFDKQLPYTINPDGGPVFLVFPVSPTLALIGATEYKDAFNRHGLLHSDVPDEAWVELINAQICRFAYEAVLAQSIGHEEMIAKYTDVSPVHEAVPLQVGKGIATFHRHVFGPRLAKPKWKAE
ncbi:MAG: DUF4238 domain-containing protein [Rhodoferax sp.]|nr:MAG: DUF4238 domain-containing protein [Rhodoferax sp.]